MQTIYNNGRIAVTKDLVFGLVVWDGNVWFPISNMDTADLQLVRDLVDYDPVFPWKDELAAARPSVKSSVTGLIPVVR